jgi:hypothetical protein
MASTFIHPLLDDTAQRLLWKIANSLYTGLGLSGAERVNDTATHTGAYWVFHAITDCVLTSISYGNPTGGAAAGDTIKAGDRIYGNITSLRLLSGTGELYRASMP